MQKAKQPRKTTALDDLIGASIRRIGFSKQQLQFETSKGQLDYQVHGDCCSSSEFWDFFGVEHLLKNGEVLDVEEIALDPADGRPTDDDECVQYYGYRITTEHPVFGKVSSVFSFRNLSNGYYGGWLEKAPHTTTQAPTITQDVSEAA